MPPSIPSGERTATGFLLRPSQRLPDTSNSAGVVTRQRSHALRRGDRGRGDCMSPPTLPLFTDPAEASPEERTRALAAVLAAGLLRLRPPLTTPDSLTILPSQNSRESLANELAL